MLERETRERGSGRENALENANRQTVEDANGFTLENTNRHPHEEDNNERWSLVQRKMKPLVVKQGRMDIEGTWKGRRDDAVSFYFSDFPDSHGAKEMFRAFKLYGKVVEVVIPPKRNAWGKRFGFARFVDVVEPQLFAVRLDNIIFGADKIHVNLPRFSRHEAKASLNKRRTGGHEAPLMKSRKTWREVLMTTKESGEAKGQAVVSRWEVKGQASVSRIKDKEEANGKAGKEVIETAVGKVIERRGGSGKQYQANNNDRYRNTGEWRGHGNGRDAPKSNKLGHGNGAGTWNKKLNYSQHGKKVVNFRKKNLSEVWYNASSEELDGLEKMYVGIVHQNGSTHAVQEWFHMQGIFTIKATPMGANRVLLEEMEEGFIQALIDDAKDWVNEKFEDIRQWSPSEVDNERIVWVRCHGVPVHAWNNEFFSSLARKFGTFLGVDENTRKKKSLDVARVLIRTKCYDVFNMVVEANINDSKFNIKVLEEWCGPLHWEGLTSAYDSEKADEGTDSEYESDDDDDGEDGPPLFNTDEFARDGSDEDEEEDQEGNVERTIIKEGLAIVSKLTNEEEGIAERNAASVEDVPSEEDAQKPKEPRGEKEITVVMPNGTEADNQALSDEVCGPNNVNGFPNKEALPEPVYVALKVNPRVDEGSMVQCIQLGNNVEVTDCGSSNEGLINETTMGQGESSGKFNAHILCCNDPGPILSNSFGPLRRNKKSKKSKNSDSSSHSGHSVGNLNEVVIGIVNDEARSLIPPLQTSNSGSGETRIHMVSRKPPNSDISFSINCDEEGAVIGDASVGDSEISFCNKRFLVAHELSLANKMWSFAKETLGVTGNNKEGSGCGGEEEYIDKLRSMEDRDQNKKGRKGKKNGSQ